MSLGPKRRGMLASAHTLSPLTYLSSLGLFVLPEEGILIDSLTFRVL